MRKIHYRCGAALFLSSLLLVSCSPASNTLTILTDRKELASAVEIYSTMEDAPEITLQHIPSIDLAVLKKENPHLVIASYLEAPELLELFRPQRFSPDIYPALTPPQNAGKRNLITPLSFGIPLIMGLSSTMDALPDSSCVLPEDLRTAADGFARRSRDGRLQRLGFSPLWNPFFIVDLLAARDITIFEEGWESSVDEKISLPLQEVQEWISESAGSVNEDTAFNTRYRYIPDEYLLLQKRILFARTDFSEWARLPETVSNKLDIRSLKGERHIPVTYIVSAAIPKTNNFPKPAEKFVQWLSMPETQALLMDRWEKDGLPVFGFLGGLSALPEVNEGILTDRFPAAAGKIPENHLLSVPRSIPHRWQRIRDEVLVPWFIRNITDKQAETESFSEAFRKWDLSSLSETDEPE